jgi:hypothetical protein
MAYGAIGNKLGVGGRLGLRQQIGVATATFWGGYGNKLGVGDMIQGNGGGPFMMWVKHSLKS